VSESRVGGLAAAVGEQFSFEESVGGVRGMIESVLPVIVFTGWYAVTRDLWPSAVAAVAVAVIALLVRVVMRHPVTPAISGLLGIVVAAGVALITGQAINFFLLSILKNVGLAVLFAASSVLRWPLVGVMLGMLLKEQFHWRTVPARMRVYQLATWLWVGMSLVRLAFQVPLYLHDHVAGLGAASVPLGLPLYGLVLLLTWLIVRRVPVARPPDPVVEPDPDPDPS
jgi:intracellular septation protein A